MNTTQHIITIIAVVLATLITRFLPFILFPGNKKTPAFIQYLGKTLPYAVIGLLIVYCLKDVSFITSPFGIYEVIAILVIVIVHVLKRNVLLSIASGTILYMGLLQLF